MAWKLDERSDGWYVVDASHPEATRTGDVYGPLTRKDALAILKSMYEKVAADGYAARLKAILDEYGIDYPRI